MHQISLRTPDYEGKVCSSLKLKFDLLCRSSSERASEERGIDEGGGNGDPLKELGTKEREERGERKEGRME